MNFKIGKHAVVVMKNKETGEVIYKANVETSDFVVNKTGERNHYSFLIIDEDGRKRVHKHYTEDDLLEQDILNIEESILEESEEPISCYFIGRNFK